MLNRCQGQKCPLKTIGSRAVPLSSAPAVLRHLKGSILLKHWSSFGKKNQRWKGKGRCSGSVEPLLSSEQCPEPISSAAGVGRAPWAADSPPCCLELRGRACWGSRAKETKTFQLHKSGETLLVFVFNQAPHADPWAPFNHLNSSTSK